jgi:hypothetical protein
VIQPTGVVQRPHGGSKQAGQAHPSCDRISPKARLPSFVGTGCSEPDYIVRIDGDFFMPGRCIKDRDQEPEKKPDDHWREPPGYLGEAVRRAKRIPSQRDQIPSSGA